MPWAGGTFTRTNGTYSGAAVWQSDAAAAIKIRADRHDTHDQDLAQGINNTLTKDGQNSPNQNISWGGFKITSLADGTAAGDAVNLGQMNTGSTSKVSRSGDTMTGKLIIDGNIAAGGLSIRNNSGANLLDVGMGASGAADPTVFFANRANGNITFLANNALVATMTVGGGFSAVGNVTVGGGSVIGSANLVVAPAAAGGVFVRPDGPASTVSQTVFSTTRATYTAPIASFFGTVATQVGVRDIGWVNAVRRWQEVIEPNADYSLYAFDAAGAGLGIRLRIDSATGNVTAVNFTATSDARLKDITRKVEPVFPTGLRWAEWNWKADGTADEGIIAQDLREAGLGQFVHEDGDGTLSVNYQKLACYLALARRH